MKIKTLIKQEFYKENFNKIFEEAKSLNKKYSFFINIKNGQEKIKENSFVFTAKDNICSKGLITTAGSKILENYLPSFNATSINKLEENNGVLIGKTSMDEFGFGTFSTNCGFKIPKNPIDKKRSCGGSSGGAAGYVKASKFPTIALAESTGGSISCPASFCNVVGLTPTYGLVSRYGLIDYANSLDRIGVVTKTTSDAALALSMISGYDDKDATSLNKKNSDYSRFCNKDVKGMKVAIPKEYLENVDENIKKIFLDSITKLDNSGIKYKEVSLKYLKYSVPTYYILATSEASTNLAKYCGIRYGMDLKLKESFNEYFSEVRNKFLGKETKRRILLGTFARMEGYRNLYYIKAAKVRTLIINEFKRLFSTYDIILAPTMPIFPPKFKDIEKLTPLQIYQMDLLTIHPSLAGLPMLTVPIKNSKLPVGLHIIADHLKEGNVIKLGDYYEKN